MGGQGQIASWVRAHLLAVVRVGLLVACAIVLVIVSGNFRARGSDAEWDAAVARTNAIAKSNALRLAWDRREQAAVRSGQRRYPRELAESHVWQPSPGAANMIAVAETTAGSRRMVALMRESVHERWQLAVEVPLVRWPWGSDMPPSEDREPPFSIETPFWALNAARSIWVGPIVVPLSEGRTLMCAGLSGHVGGPPDHVCVAVDDAQPERPFLLGSAPQ